MNGITISPAFDLPVVPDQTVTCIEYWYDRSVHLWTASRRNSDGMQIGNCEHAHSREEIMDTVNEWKVEHPAVVITKGNIV